MGDFQPLKKYMTPPTRQERNIYTMSPRGI